MSQELSEQEEQRRLTLQKIREMGMEPYPAEAFEVTHFAESIKAEFVEHQTVQIAGRMMSQRIMGKASFAELQDSSGRIQVYFNRDELCPGEDKTLYNEVFKKLLDLGDFIGITGQVFKTQVGEISVNVTSFKLLSKALKPLPLPKTDADGNTHDAFTDPELRYRQRYVDLVVNPKVKETFVTRSKVFSVMRK
ncbi:MAG: lysine--tRNA ligase, partial [Flavobacteriia bacterium]|nr:lysine--tRNA ligase [Flavobacteriia bacterium]